MVASPGAEIFTTLAVALSEAGEWKLAAQTFQEMRQARLVPKKAVCIALLSSMAKANQWQRMQVPAATSVSFRNRRAAHLRSTIARWIASPTSEQRVNHQETSYPNEMGFVRGLNLVRLKTLLLSVSAGHPVEP